MTQLSHSGLKCSPGASDDKKRVKKTFLKGNCCSQKTLHSHLRSPSNHGCCEVTHTIYEQIVIRAKGRAVFLFVSLKVTFRSDVCKITYSCKAPGDRKSAFMCPERKAINKSVLFNKKGHKCSWWTSPTFCCWIHSHHVSVSLPPDHPDKTWNIFPAAKLEILSVFFLKQPSLTLHFLDRISSPHLQHRSNSCWRRRYASAEVCRVLILLFFNNQCVSQAAINHEPQLAAPI